jgi:hypothetical protein
MTIDPMKLSFLKLKTNSYLKHNKAVRVSLPYTQAKNIGIIFSVEDKIKHDEVKDFIRHLEQDGKQVKVVCFLPKNKDNYEFMFDYFTDKDFSFWGNVTSSITVNFAETPFDFLFYVDTTPNPLILNLVARSKARCRVGKFWDHGQRFFELMIESRNGTRSLIETMYRYTRALK